MRLDGWTTAALFAGVIACGDKDLDDDTDDGGLSGDDTAADDGGDSGSGSGDGGSDSGSDSGITGLPGDYLSASRHYCLDELEEGSPGEYFLTYQKA